MHQHRTQPKQNYITKHNGYYSTLTVAVFPLAIYFLQVLGKISTIAACAAGVLVVLKVVIEWFHANYKQQPIPLAAPSQRKKPPCRLVPYHPPIAGCYFCQQYRPLRPYEKFAICQTCYICLTKTQHRI